MRRPIINQVLGGKRYNSATGTVLASNEYWDGHNWERSGRNTWLMRAPRGSYYAVHATCWQGEHNRIEPLTPDEAVALYESLREHEYDFEQAFPSVEVTEA